MSEVIFGLVGVLIGVIVTLIIHQHERRDRYLFAIIQERLSTAQEAYEWSLRMKSVIHGDEEVRSEVLTEVREWFNSNSLYLPPDIRRDFDRIINNVWDYKDELSYYRQLKSEGKKEEAEKQHSELMHSFKGIINLSRRIERSVSVYYEFENAWSIYQRLWSFIKPKRDLE